MTPLVSVISEREPPNHNALPRPFPRPSSLQTYTEVMLALTTSPQTETRPLQGWCIADTNTFLLDLWYTSHPWPKKSKGRGSGLHDGSSIQLRLQTDMQDLILPLSRYPFAHLKAALCTACTTTTSMHDPSISFPNNGSPLRARLTGYGRI